MLRTLVVLGAAAAVVAAQAAGARAGPWEQGIVFGLAVLTAIRPESSPASGCSPARRTSGRSAPETLSPLVLLAAAGMVLAHVSALVAAQGPARMGSTARRYAAGLRAACCSGSPPPPSGGSAWLVADLPQGRLAYALGLTLLTVDRRWRRPGCSAAARTAARSRPRGQYQPAPCL